MASYRPKRVLRSDRYGYGYVVLCTVVGSLGAIEEMTSSVGRCVGRSVFGLRPLGQTADYYSTLANTER
jgi:hypothetical protein